MSYSGAASNIAQELLELLGEEEVDQLREELVAMGEECWIDRDAAIRSEALAFLSANPAKREKLKKWKDPTLRRHLVLSAYRLASLASTVLSESSRLEDCRGASWRDVAAAGGAAGMRIVQAFLWEWPFFGPAPFPEWEPPPPPPRSPSYTVIMTPDGPPKIIGV